VCARYPYLSWRKAGNPPRPFKCNTWKCTDCEPKKRHATVEIVRRWCVEHDITRAVTLTLDPSAVTAEKLQPHMPEGESAAALMERCTRYCWRKDKKSEARRYVLTFSGGDKDEREALRRGLVRYINYLWNKARTRMKTRYRIEYVRVLELHDDEVRPHIHLLVSEYVPIEYWRTVWTAAGGGRNLKIKRIRDRIEDAARYLMKYLTKAAHSCDPEAWPRGARRIVVSRALSLTLSPAERKIIEEYKAREKTPDGPCLGGYSPETLDGMNNEQCRECIWKKRRVCRWKPPGVFGYLLYDDRRGILVHPISRTAEEERDKAWWSFAAWSAYKRVPSWARGDRRTEVQFYEIIAQEILEEHVPPFGVDPYHHFSHVTGKKRGGGLL